MAEKPIKETYVMRVSKWYARSKAVAYTILVGSGLVIGAGLVTQNHDLVGAGAGISAAPIFYLTGTAVAESQFETKPRGLEEKL